MSRELPYWRGYQPSDEPAEYWNGGGSQWAYGTLSQNGYSATATMHLANFFFPREGGTPHDGYKTTMKHELESLVRERIMQDAGFTEDSFTNLSQRNLVLEQVTELQESGNAKIANSIGSLIMERITAQVNASTEEVSKRLKGSRSKG